MIISSSALRAKTTAQHIAQEIGYKKEIKFDTSVYASTYGKLDEIIKNIDDEDETLFFIGHNPELNMLAELYVDFDENIVTCGVIEIEFETENWKNISSENSLGCFSKLLLIKKLIDEKNIYNIICKFILLFKPIFIFF